MAEGNNNANAPETAGAQPQESADPVFAVQRIYLKDASYEAPGVPKILSKDWKPEINLDINTRTAKLNNDHYEVVITLTVTATSQEDTAFIIEVQQAGLFQIDNLEDARLKHTLGAFCPNILFPYAREAVDNLAVKGSFPPLMLAPVNFDAIFNEQMHKQQAASQETH